MTKTAPEIDATPGSPADNPDTANLVRLGMDQVLKGKISLADLFERVSMPPTPATLVDLTPPPPPSLTQDVLKAIKRLPEVFGKVTPSKPRKLTLAEQQALVEEREVIDQVIAVLEKRKKEGIREALANHLDAVLPEEKRVRKDRKGHWAPWETQDVPVEGTDKKLQRFSSGGKPNLTIANVEKMLADGVIDRKTYLAVTCKPESPRVLDQHKLHQAIQKNPRLLFLFASWSEASAPTTTVKVEKNT